VNLKNAMKVNEVQHCFRPNNFH